MWLTVRMDQSANILWQENVIYDRFRQDRTNVQLFVDNLLKCTLKEGNFASEVEERSLMRNKHFPATIHLD